MARLSLSALIALVIATPAQATSWADGLFNGLSHDFGVVARGPTLSHVYRITNTTGTPVHISGIRVSCGCTTASVAVADLAPGQSTDLTAQMDTRRFMGTKSVTIFVQFDRPQWEEVRLTVAADAREDVAASPESMAFGNVVRGTSPSKSVTFTIHGTSTQLVAVQAASNYVQLVAKTVKHTDSESVYDVTATLRADTPIGKWFTDVWLITNGSSSQRIRVPVSVEVTSALQLSSPVLAFGQCQPGDKIEKRIIVRGQQPFRILSIGGTNETITASAGGDEAKPVHVLVVGISPSKPGDFAHTLKIVTDHPNDSTIDVPITATVVMPHAN
jgi:hypothetical protein